MLRSRLLIPIAALSLLAVGGCHSGAPAESPTSRAETTSAETRAFPKDDARTALNAAARGLKSCDGDASTVIDASLEFEPSGKVGSVEVRPAEEPVASCVRTKLAEVAVMPFDGEPVKMTMRVRL